MNIEEFVKAALKQIADAATSVEDKEKGQCVNPEIPVHFDLAVTTTEKSGVEGGGQLVVASLLKAGGGANKANEVQEYSRVSFDLNFHIPSKSFSS